MTTQHMSRSLRDLVGYAIDATDGTSIGKVYDFLVDEEKFAIRYMVAETGSWFSKQKVLVSPRHLEEPDLGLISRHFPVNLTRKQIEECPCPPMSDPEIVTRHYESRYAQYYGHPVYWDSGYTWGVGGIPAYIPPSVQPDKTEPAPSEAEIQEQMEKTHLRSFSKLRSYGIAAADGEIGKIDDMIVECTSWQLKYVVVDTNKWLPGGKVLLAIDWFDKFDWGSATAVVGDLTKEQIKGAPKFDPSEGVNEDYKHRLYDYYGKPVEYYEPPATPY